MINLDSHDEQSLVVLFKEALQQYQCYLRQSHFDGKSINEFPVKSPVLNFEDIEWKNLVMHWSRSQDEVLSMKSHDNLNFYFSACALRIFLQEICSKKNSGLTRTTGYRKYATCCFALVSTCYPVSLYLHTYLVHYVTAVCMIACLSIVRSKLSDLYEWLH